MEEEKKMLGEEAEEAAGEVSWPEEYSELNDKYLRLYAEFENYKKLAIKERAEAERKAFERLIAELLPSLDYLEIALKHAGDDIKDGLKEGVENTLRELNRTLERFGLKPIDALLKPFDPEFHHAMTLLERDDVEDKTVVEELRKGYMLGDKVLRASLVAVSKRPVREEKPAEVKEIAMNEEED